MASPPETRAPAKKLRPQTHPLVDAIAFPLATILLLLAIAGAYFGSRRHDSASVRPPFTVPKQHVLNPPTDRMLAAIVLRGEKAWFFKATGPIDRMSEQEDRFRRFLKSVQFGPGAAASQGDVPVWTLPDGWEEIGGSTMRFATIRMDGNPDDTDDRNGDDLELSVTELPKTLDDDRTYVLRNVNRWRGQLRLSPIAPSEVDRRTETIPMKNAEALFVDISGRMDGSAGPMGSMAFSGPSPGSASGGSSNDDVEFTYDSPEGWRELGAGGMRRAAFAISSDAGRQAEVTVIPLRMDSSVLDNVNRWRDQVHLPPISDDDLSEQMEDIEVGSLRGQYVKLIGSEQSDQPASGILGVILDRDGTQWYFKLSGDAATAESEEENFKQFVRSFKFTAG